MLINCFRFTFYIIRYVLFQQLQKYWAGSWLQICTFDSCLAPAQLDSFRPFYFEV